MESPDPPHPRPHTHHRGERRSLAMAMDSLPAPAAKLPTPPYHHSPRVEDAATPPPKPTGQRLPLPSPLQLSGYSLHELLLLSSSSTSRRNQSRVRGAAGIGVDSSLEMAGATPKRRRHGTGEQRRLEKEIEPEMVVEETVVGQRSVRERVGEGDGCCPAAPAR